MCGLHVFYSLPGGLTRQMADKVSQAYGKE